MSEATQLELWEAYIRLHIAMYGKPPTYRISSKDDIILAILNMQVDIEDDNL